MHDMPSIHVAVHDQFFDAMIALRPSEQRKVQEFVTKFRANPRSRGINYEKIRDAREPGFRSARVNQDLRAIVLTPEQGNVYLLMWVDRHDDAYAWARRTHCNINPNTGVLQVYRTDVVEAPQTEKEAKIDAKSSQNAANSSKTGEKSPQRPKKKLLNVSTANFLNLGVPQTMLERVQDLRTSDELDAAKAQLPTEAYEALRFLADGEPLQSILDIYGAQEDESIDTHDVERALHRDGTKRRFRLVTDDEELLQQMLNAPLEKWRYYLHPSQRGLVQWNVNGPIRVLGGAGTGKTVVAMHRAKWLVSQDNPKPAKRVLFTTFTKNLALDIEKNLEGICSPEELSRIEVTNINAWVHRFLKQHAVKQTIIYPGRHEDLFQDLWGRAEDLAPDDAYPELDLQFCKNEWDRVILPQNIQDKPEYFRASRKGRGVPLNRKKRAMIWPVFEAMYRELAYENAMTFEQAVHEANRILEERETFERYDAVVVDEAQDLGSSVFQLLRNIAPVGPNDMFIVGDAHQRIYARFASLGASGVHIVGRSRKLRVNYRTTEEIRNRATSILEGVDYDDLDGGQDSASSAQYKSLVRGEAPVLAGFEDFAQEANAIADWIHDFENDPDRPIRRSEMCVVARTSQRVKNYAAALNERNISTQEIDSTTHAGRGSDEVAVATMHRVKGLEFKVMFVAGATDGVIPLARALDAAQDAAEKRRFDKMERSLFHVACTRAAQHLRVTWSGKRSRYLLGA